MIDIHHHCLPGVDDGPRNLGEAADLCRRAHDDGITTIIATPHVLRGAWQNRSRAALSDLLDRLRETVGDAPKLLLGSEYYFDHDMEEVLAAGDGIIPLAGSRYILVEFDPQNIPPLVGQPLYRIQLSGWTPIIAHPERNLVFQSKPELLRDLVRRGARLQVTAGSIMGDFGPEARRAALRWLEEGLVHFIASDAHNLKRRPPRMTDAFRAASSRVGEDLATALCFDNPQAVLDNRQLPWDPDGPPAESPPGFMTRLRRFLKPQ